MRNIYEVNNVDEFHVSNVFSDYDKISSIMPKDILIRDDNFYQDISKNFIYLHSIAHYNKKTKNTGITTFEKLHLIINENEGFLCGDLYTHDSTNA